MREDVREAKQSRETGDLPDTTGKPRQCQSLETVRIELKTLHPIANDLDAGWDQDHDFR